MRVNPQLILDLCSPRCAGRRPGTPGGDAARALVLGALRDAGLDAYEQPVPACGGGNVLALIPGDAPGWVVVGAHFDHLGTTGRHTFWGADDNAAAVAVLVAVARALRGERAGRGVIIAAFDGEEPPFFMTGAMGSQAFCAAPPVPLASIELMVCMDLVGHRLGPALVPDDVGDTVFALGSERSAGTAALVERMKRATPGLVVRRADADIIPPLSDYDAFWRARIPFLFLSAGRSRVYHTPDDTPDKLDFPKIEATARWLAAFVRETRRRDAIAFDVTGAGGDAATLDELAELTRALAPLSRDAGDAVQRIATLRGACDRTGRLPDRLRFELGLLVGALESGLAG